MRERDSENSSLDLLLDTMTNAFGGVVFLSILLSLQLNDRTTKVLMSSGAETEAAVYSAESELTFIKGAIQRQLDLALTVISSTAFSASFRL